MEIDDVIIESLIRKDPQVLLYLESFIDYQNGMSTHLEDDEFDKLEKKVLFKYPNLNPWRYYWKNLPPEFETYPHRGELEELDKWAKYEISDYWNKEEGKIKLPKWDGSSIVIYYTKGKLAYILSMSDKLSGIVQTNKFSKFVPQSIDPLVSYLRAEVVIDIRLNDNPRGKANGLVNSKYMQEEVDELISIVVFQGISIDNSKIPYSDLKEYLKDKAIIRSNRIPKFILSPEVHELKEISRGIVEYNSSNINFQFPIDGIVYLEDPEYHKSWAWKYYYINSAITEVLDIRWNETEKECWSSVLSVNPVWLDGKSLSNPSTNGVPNLIHEKMGIGSKVKVIFSGLTIPKVLEVVDPVEVKLPKCPYCGHQFTEDDLLGAYLKCPNEDCPKKFENRDNWVQSELKKESKRYSDFTSMFNDWVEWFLCEFTILNRFNYKNKRKIEFTDEVKEEIIKHIKNLNFKGALEWFQNNYYFTDLMYKELKINLKSTIVIFNKYLRT